MDIKLPDARRLSDEVLLALRLRALRGVEMGYTETELAELLGVSLETISRWWSAYTSDGLSALPQERSGRPQQFFPVQRGQIVSAADGGAPTSEVDTSG